MRYWEPWKFETAHFTVALQVDDCPDDPADMFESRPDIDAIRNGECAWFDCRLVVRRKSDGKELGADSLGACAYTEVEEFYTSHRDSNPMNRNCTLMRAAKGGNVVICHYFPGMVRQAIQAARATMALEIVDQVS